MFGISRAGAVMAVAACVLSGSVHGESTKGGAARAHVKARLERAYRLAGEGKTAEAMAAFKGVLKMNPGNHAAIVQMGYLHAGLKQWKSAAQLLKAAVGQNPENMRLRMDLGYAYQALKDMPAAQAEFELVARQPGEFQEQAQTALTTVRDARYASSGKQGRMIAEAYAALREGDKLTARRKFEMAAMMEPKNPAVLKQLGFMHLEEGRLAAAVGSFESARSMEPNDHFSALQLGYLYQKLDKIDQARSAFSSALASGDMKIQAAAQAALRPAGEASMEAQLQ